MCLFIEMTLEKKEREKEMETLRSFVLEFVCSNVTGVDIE